MTKLAAVKRFIGLENPRWGALPCASSLLGIQWGSPGRGLLSCRTLQAIGHHCQRRLEAVQNPSVFCFSCKHGWPVVTFTKGASVVFPLQRFVEERASQLPVASQRETTPISQKPLKHPFWEGGQGCPLLYVATGLDPQEDLVDPSPLSATRELSPHTLGGHFTSPCTFFLTNEIRHSCIGSVRFLYLES